MNTNPIVPAAFGFVARVAPLAACLALAACSGNQNWNDKPAYVSIGGSVAGLTGGTVVLQNNGQDDLPIAANGTFTFGLSIANGKSYAVTVLRQPTSQVCTVANGSGTATADVASVAVTCRSNVTIGGTISGLSGGTVVLLNNGGNPLATAANGPFTFTASVANGSVYAVLVRDQPAGQSCSTANYTGTATANVTNVTVVCSTFTLRPLPAIYATGKAINYSAFRAGGPGAGEIPSDADVVQDLGLLHSAGFDLLRLFGADDVSDKILRLAARYYPDMRFQQGLVLFGIPPEKAGSCQDNFDGGNDGQVARAIALANQYSNVVTVSVGNEQSFFSRYMPPICLENFITRVRNSVTQPVTADDDWTYYAGLTAAGGDRAAVKPDKILPLIDFVSIHSYAILNDSQWNWQQLGVPAGPARAEAMMNASLAYARDTYGRVASYSGTPTGSMTSIGASLPITIGETGWKAVQTTPTSQIERYAALEVNAKWYYDLLRSWERTAGGPAAIFYFEAFDEAWKGIDDGWGLWTRARAPRYGLCGTPAGTACNADLYQGAGYYR